MGDTVYSRLPSELLDLSGILDIYFGNLLPPENFLYYVVAIYTRLTEYTVGTNFSKKFTTDLIDVTGMSFLKGSVDLRSASTSRFYLNLAGTGGGGLGSTLESRVLEITNNDYDKQMNETSSSYVTHTFYLYVGDLTGDQQFDFYGKSSNYGYSKNFYLFPQFNGVIS